MTKNVINGSCLARSLETQALEGTGFRTSLRQFISHLDESQKAYDMIAVDDPATKCLFVASMVHQMPVCSQYGKVGSSCQLPTPGLSGED